MYLTIWYWCPNVYATTDERQYVQTLISSIVSLWVFRVCRQTQLVCFVQIPLTHCEGSELGLIHAAAPEMHTGEERTLTCWQVLANGGWSSRRRIQSPVQVSPELLLVLRMHQLIHTLVHDVSLREITYAKASTHVQESNGCNVCVADTSKEGLTKMEARCALRLAWDADAAQCSSLLRPVDPAKGQAINRSCVSACSVREAPCGDQTPWINQKPSCSQQMLHANCLFKTCF